MKSIWPIDVLLKLLNELMDASLALDYDRARGILLKAVKEYSPANGIDDLVWIRKLAVESAAGQRHGGRFSRQKGLAFAIFAM